MNRTDNIKTVTTWVGALEPSFNEIAIETKNQVSYKKEANFALQMLQANDFLCKTAINNPQSLKSAILNIASIGLTLNPVEKKAYLIPRKGVVCLDISYMGLVDVAIKSGAIRFIQAKLVHQDDTFEYRGTSQEPLHTFNPFKKKGEIVGVYCFAKTYDNDFLTEMMSVEEINEIRNRSESFKRGSGPWVSDYGEMAKKTVVKRFSKLLPKHNAALNEAIDIINLDEGIDFEQERIEQEEKRIKKLEEEKEKRDFEREHRITLIDEIVKLSSQITKDLNLESQSTFFQNVLKVNNVNLLHRHKTIVLEEILKEIERIMNE